MDLVNENNVKMIEYKTGYAEFMVTKLEMSGESTAEKSFNSLSIAIVLKGSATVEIEGFEPTQMEDKSCYYIMPGQKFTVKSKKDLLVFFASCDI